MCKLGDAQPVTVFEEQAWTTCERLPVKNDRTDFSIVFGTGRST